MSGNTQQSIKDYTKAIELAPQLPNSYGNRATSYYFLKEYLKAIEDYTKVTELSPTDLVSFYNRGLSYRQIGKHQEAIADFTKVIDLDQGNINTDKVKNLMTDSQNILNNE